MLNFPWIKFSRLVSLLYVRQTWKTTAPRNISFTCNLVLPKETLITWNLKWNSQIPALLPSFLYIDLSLCSVYAFSSLGDSNRVVVSVSIDCSLSLWGDTSFHHKVFDHSHTDWDYFHDHLTIWVLHAATSLYELVQILIDVSVPCVWQEKLLETISFVCTNRINLVCLWPILTRQRITGKEFLDLLNSFMLLKQRSFSPPRNLALITFN